MMNDGSGRPMCLYAAVPYDMLDRLRYEQEKLRITARWKRVLLVGGLILLTFLVWLAWWLGQVL